MLQIIRDWTTGWLATAIVALLIIPFAFWGITSYFGATEPVVASVNDEKIKLTQFQRAFNLYRQQLQTLLDQDIDIDDEAVKRQALNRLIDSILLEQATRDSGLQVSDNQVLETIMGIEAFRTEDGFNRAYYEQTVLRLGMQPAAYEQQMRQDLSAAQLQSAVIESVFVSDEEAVLAARLQNQTRDFKYTLISARDIREELEVSEEEIREYFEKNKERYATPEKVRIAYIELSVDKLAEEVPVDEQSLQDYYASNKADFDEKEQRKINQLLIKIDENDTEADIEAAREKAVKIRQAIDEGKTFKDITEEYTDDPSFSFTEYGFMLKGVLPEPVDEAVFALEPDGVTDVVQSEKGFHIIELVDMKGGVLNTFENNRAEVEAAYRKSLAEEQFFEQADRLAVAAYEHPETLEVAADETGLPIQTSELFSREGTEEGLTSREEITSASFAKDTLQDGLNSEMLELSDTHLVVLRVREHQPESIPPLEEVREEVVSDIKFARGGELARDKGEFILESLREGKDFSTVADQHAVEWKEATEVKRDDVSVVRAILRKAFSMGGSGSDLPVYDGVALGTGDYAVIALESVQTPSADSLDEETIQQVKTELQESRSANAWSEMVQQLRKEADIEIYEDRI
ncbi:MAG TPA: SurA N-terminal domain-containing protein [Gammaproteobacteria bacterium]|nr:SurA N-terminal domain-containing protein [Gammaproteobacteria bacterium]